MQELALCTYLTPPIVLLQHNCGLLFFGLFHSVLPAKYGVGASACGRLRARTGAQHYKASAVTNLDW